jgi:hypothetical protein
MNVALAVGFTEPDSPHCQSLLDVAGWRIARAAHAATACERAFALRPALVVLSRSLFASEKRAIREAVRALELPVVEAADVSDLYLVLSRSASGP